MPPPPADRTPSIDESPMGGGADIGRAAVRGGIVGFFFVGLLVTGLMVVVGGGPAAVGVGAYVGFFGGIGFGAMLAAMWESDRVARKATRPRRRAAMVPAEALLGSDVGEAARRDVTVEEEQHLGGAEAAEGRLRVEGVGLSGDQV